MSLTTHSGGVAEIIAATDGVSEELEERQSTVGEGPSLDVLHGHAALLLPDLSSTDSMVRWPVFTASAAKAGVSAMFSFPIRADDVAVGVMDVYRFKAGDLTDDELADALSFADAALALALDRYGSVEPPVDDLFSARRAAIHQASGMVSVQLGISVADALARLRAYAFAHDRQLADVADDVVARKLRFGNDTS